MSDIIKDPVLVSAIQDLARGIKSEADLSSLTRELLKITVEASLNAEMEAHLGYPKHSPTGLTLTAILPTISDIKCTPLTLLVA